MKIPLTNMEGRYITPSTKEAFDALVGMGYKTASPGAYSIKTMFLIIDKDGIHRYSDEMRFDSTCPIKQSYYHKGHFYDEPYEEFTITEEKVPFPDRTEDVIYVVEAPTWYPKDFIYTNCGKRVESSEISNEDFEFLKLLYENSKDFKVKWGPKIDRCLHKNRPLALAIGDWLVKNTGVQCNNGLILTGIINFNKSKKPFLFGYIMIDRASEATLADDYIIPDQVIEWMHEYEK